MGRTDDKGFSIFRSAGEEAEMRERDELQQERQGGHVSRTGGRVVSSPGAKCLQGWHDASGRWHVRGSSATSREAEAFVCRNTPCPPARFDGHATEMRVSERLV